MKIFFRRWWLPLVIHTLILIYLYVSEQYRKPTSANDINFGGAAMVLLSCIILIASVIYQVVAKNMIAGFITLAVLIGTISYLFV